MRKIILAGCLILALIGATASGLPQASKYPETSAVLQLLHDNGIKAARTYSVYARQAHSEKQYNIESLFIAIAASELMRVDTFRYLLEELGIYPGQVDRSDIRVSSTKFNLRLMTKIESANIDTRHTLLLKKIKPEGHAVAIANLTHNWKVELQHRDLAKEALSSLDSFFGIASGISEEFYVCMTCGSTLEEEPEFTCPICQGPISDYQKASAKWQFYSYINSNTELTGPEKDYAKRRYDFIYDNTNDQQDFELNPQVFFSPLYRKWGLGDRREFLLEEKIYLSRIDETAQIWDEYESIDLINLDQADKDFLEQLHDKYGIGPIDLRHHRRKEKGNLSDEEKKLLDIVEIVSGRTLFEDNDLIFLRNWAAKRGKDI